MQPLHNRRLLVVEDEYMLADDLQRALTAAGAVVVGPVATEAKALQLIAADECLDGAVLDMNLGGQTSERVADRLADRNVPFVLATGYGPEITFDRFADVPRWEKPYDAHVLAAALPRIFF